jgi:dimethylargininase
MEKSGGLGFSVPENPHFKKAIVRIPCKNITKGITSGKLGKPIYSLALQQHKYYMELLKTIGLELTVLQPLQDFPDSTFVEDVALVKNDMAILSYPGSPSRQGEQKAIAPVIRKLFTHVHQIKPPGTCEPGDIMMVLNHFYIGLSARTNQEGADQMVQILKTHDYTATIVPLKEMLHLKSGVNYLDEKTILVCGEFIDNPIFDKFKKIVIPEDEAYAANSLWVNDIVLVPDGFPKSLCLIQDAGFIAVTINMSEFEKIDGGLSCLSLRY